MFYISVYVYANKEANDKNPHWRIVVYGRESWTILSQYRKRLEAFKIHMDVKNKLHWQIHKKWCAEVGWRKTELHHKLGRIHFVYATEISLKPTKSLKGYVNNLLDRSRSRIVVSYTGLTVQCLYTNVKSLTGGRVLHESNNVFTYTTNKVWVITKHNCLIAIY